MSAPSFADAGSERVNDALRPVAIREMAIAQVVLPIKQDLAMSMQHWFADEGRRDRADASRPATDLSLERVMRRVVLLGALLVILVPAARGHSDWFGALPLWLVGMPLASWWALHRFRLPLAWRPAARQAASIRHNPRRPQARRRTPAPRLHQRKIARVA